MPPVGINPIWAYFSKNNDKAKCKICSKLLSLGSSLPKKQTTTNIKNHLAKLHKIEWAVYFKAYEIHQNLLKKKSGTNNLQDKKEETKSNPSTIPDIIENPPWPDNDPVSLRIDQSIMDLIIVDMLPYNLVEGEAFHRLNFTDPDSPSRYRKKSEKYFRTTLMPATYEKVKLKVMRLLEEAVWVSFTTDIWRNLTKSCSLLSFTAHFIKGPRREKVILAVSVLGKDHTGQRISNQLSQIIGKFNLKNKIHMGICDSAYNMQAAMNCENFASIVCVAQTLQLVIHDVILKNDDVIGIVKKCRKIVEHFERSEQHILVQDDETRWNTTYLMLKRLVEQKNYINMYMVETGGLELPTAEEWVQINNYLTVLKYFYQAMLDISSDYSSISLIIPLIAMLNSKLSITDKDSSTLKELKTQLCESVNTQFSYAKNNLHLLISTLIDPRFKTKYLKTNEIENAKAEILSFLRQNESQSRETERMEIDVDKPSPSCSKSDTARINTASKCSDDLWDTHDNIAVSHDKLHLDSPPFEEHLTRFLEEPLLLRNADIYEYWCCCPYAYLRPVAVKYLSAPPTSVPSEQLFSAVGKIYAERQSNLIGENVDKLLFLAYNIRLFNFDY